MQASSAVLQKRPFAAWLRAFLSDMVRTGKLPPSRSVRTSRLVDLLAAKARCNVSGFLIHAEFDAFTRVIMNPSERVADLELEIVWAMFDLEHRGLLSVEVFDPLRRLLAMVGVTCSDEAAQHVKEQIREENDGMLTPDLYYEWLLESKQRKSRRAMPKKSAENPPKEHPRMVFSVRTSPQDQILRSTQLNEFSLFRLPLGKVEPVRSLSPTYPSVAKQPPGLAVKDVDLSPPATVRLPPVHKNIDWEAQDEWWTRRDNRLRPFMRVKTSYIRPDGTKGEAVGTLLNGWGTANKSSVIPHSRPPESARRREEEGMTTAMAQDCEPVPTAESSKLPQAASPAKQRGDDADGVSPRKPTSAGSTVATTVGGSTDERRPWEPWVKEVNKWKDVENNVVVLVHGVEKLVPRDWVVPLGTSQK